MLTFLADDQPCLSGPLCFDRRSLCFASATTAARSFLGAQPQKPFFAYCLFSFSSCGAFHAINSPRSTFLPPLLRRRFPQHRPASPSQRFVFWLWFSSSGERRFSDFPCFLFVSLFSFPLCAAILPFNDRQSGRPSLAKAFFTSPSLSLHTLFFFGLKLVDRISSPECADIFPPFSRSLFPGGISVLS